MSLPFNFLMALVDLAALGLLSSRKSLLVWCVAMGWAVAAASILAGLLGEERFGLIRLASYAFFLHGPVLLGGSAVIWWRSNRIRAVACTLGALAILSAAVDAFWIEPNWLEVSYLKIASPKIRRAQRIVVLADFQTDHFTWYERSVLQRVLEEKPDVVLLAGDYLQAPYEERKDLSRQLNTFLRDLPFTAPGGVFAVRGNVDEQDWPQLFDGLGVKVVEATESFELDQFRLTCLSVYDSYDPSLRVLNPAPARFHVVLGHLPNFALGQIEGDLLLAGHTHGGQVRLPLLGSLSVHSPIPHAWAAGLTQLSGGRQLLVSRGVGMERTYAPRLRLFCRPELVVIDLVPAGQ